MDPILQWVKVKVASLGQSQGSYLERMTPEPVLLPRTLPRALPPRGGGVFDLQHQRSAQSWGQQGLVVTEASHWTMVASGGLGKQKPVPREKAWLCHPMVVAHLLQLNRDRAGEEIRTSCLGST